MKKTIVLIVFLFFGGFIFAQNEVDALRFSEMYYSGTARANSMANAFGALGADLSTASTNPAGIAIYKHGSMAFSPSVMMSNVQSSFNGTTIPTDKLSMMFNNFGVVLASKPASNDIRALNFSFGYNRTNNFKRNYNINGVNNKGSMLDYFMIDADGNLPSEMNSYSTFLAWDTYLLDNISGDTTSYTNALLWNLAAEETPQYGENQTRIQQVTGGAGEYFFNVAFNYKDFVFFGATVGLQSFYYHSVTTYTEDNFVDNADLKSFTYIENITDNGSGINLKLGIILKPTKFLRIGGSFHSPTYFTIEDEYYTSLASYWNTPDEFDNYDYSSETEENYFQYNLLTPMKLTGDLGIILGKFLLIGINYEYIDYSAMRMSASDYMFVSENDTIRNTYHAVSNYRGGVEFRTGSLYFRGGYALLSSPYNNNNDEMNFSKSQISGGIGLKVKNFFVDVAYVRNISNYNTYLYNGYTDEPVPSIVQTDGILTVTLGSRF